MHTWLLQLALCWMASASWRLLQSVTSCWLETRRCSCLLSCLLLQLLFSVSHSCRSADSCCQQRLADDRPNTTQSPHTSLQNHPLHWSSNRTHLTPHQTVSSAPRVGISAGLSMAQVDALVLHLLRLPRQLVVFSCKGQFEYFKELCMCKSN